MKHKKVPVHQTKRVEKWLIMRDTFRMIERMIQHVREQILPADHVIQIKQMQKIQVEQLSLPLAG